VATITASQHQILYLIRSTTAEDEALVPADIIRDTELQDKFMKEYYERTGIHWRHYFGNGKPRDPPVLYMWAADRIGQSHSIESEQGYW
jgi:hypothetical protein